MNVTTMGTAKRRQRVIALCMLLALAASAVEAMASPLRDGAMHHETNAEAASHNTVKASGHRHLGSVLSTTAQTPDLDTPGDQPDHDHPGGGDHCTHVHGPALVPHVTLVFASVVVALPESFSSHREDPTYTHVPHPPRA